MLGIVQTTSLSCRDSIRYYNTGDTFLAQRFKPATKLKVKVTNNGLRVWFLSSVRKQSPRSFSVKKVFLEISKKLHENTCANFIKKETLAQVFFCEFCEISWSTFSHRTPVVAASVNATHDLEHLKRKAFRLRQIITTVSGSSVEKS